MLAFQCDVCAQLLFFENDRCLRCGTAQGFVPSRMDLSTFPDGVEAEGFRPCANRELAACNWLVEPGDDHPLCRSCRLTTVRPDDDDPAGLAQFPLAEAAKRRALFQLLDLGLPGIEDGSLRFELLSSTHGPVVTGHADGTITLDLAEAVDARRIERRDQLGEPYRTMLGHFRHELGHYVEGLLVDEVAPPARAMFRELFGDERASYADAIDRHYRDGPPADWAEDHVSAYATMHPWEAWAETWAHYLHIRDTLQTAAAHGILVTGPREIRDPELMAAPDLDVDDEPFRELLDQWLPLTYALNAVNRSMGQRDLYPFTLPPKVVRKLTYVHWRVRQCQATELRPAHVAPQGRGATRAA